MQAIIEMPLVDFLGVPRSEEQVIEAIKEKALELVGPSTKYEIEFKKLRPEHSFIDHIIAKITY